MQWTYPGGYSDSAFNLYVISQCFKAFIPLALQLRNKRLCNLEGFRIQCYVCLPSMLHEVHNVRINKNLDLLSRPLSRDSQIRRKISNGAG